MAINRFRVGFTDESTGLQTNVKPWLIADNAFSEMQNAYIFRGRVRKRFGSILMGDSQLNSRLRMKLVPAALVITTPENIAVGQAFSIGDDIFTVTSITAPYPVSLLTTSAVTARLTAANKVTFSAITTTVYWYPAKPVMGITQFETKPINDEPTYAFDTRFAYEFDETIGGWERLATGTDTWTGTDSDFFWTCNYRGATSDLTLLWATNYVPADGIRYWNAVATTWTKPTLKFGALATDTVVTARLIISFRTRLLLLNTVENVAGVNKTFVNRCRYSSVFSPLDANSWRQDIPGNGNALDAPTQEAIVTAQFLRDRLIVYFERSTWELVDTGNKVSPFVWQKINTELGAESTFSQIPFDKVVLGVGDVGIHACNGSGVERIDGKIPQLVFRIHNEDNGPRRVGGIRDYNTEMVYWTYPDGNADSTSPYPNKVLTYNYKNDSWSINDDSFTAFGYYQLGSNTPNIKWEDASTSWAENGSLWNDSSDNIKARVVLAGNQQGYMFILRQNIHRNAPSLQITTIAGTTLTVINHNLAENDYVYLENVNGITLSESIVRVSVVIDENNFTVIGTLTGTYTGGGTLSRISKISIKTKQYNFYVEEDRNAYIQRVDFLVNTTLLGEISVDYSVSTSILSLVGEGETTGALLGTSVLETFPYDEDMAPLEVTQKRVWHPVYLQAEGEFVQLHLYMNADQLSNRYIALEDFQLHAMIFFAQPTSNRLQ